MSLQGIPARPWLPVPGPGGVYLSVPQDVPDSVQKSLRDVLALVERRNNEMLKILDNAYQDIVNNTNGLLGVQGISGTGVRALNWASVGMNVGGATQFSWSFTATEPDTNYGMRVQLSGAFSPPTIMKYTNRVELHFGNVTPTGLKADLLLYR